MTFSFPDIDHVFRFSSEYVNSLVIENQTLLFSLLEDVSLQIEGYDGRAVVSRDDTLIDFPKNVELISSFFPFQEKKKALINKVSSIMIKESVNEQNYLRTMELLSQIEQYLEQLAEATNCNLLFSKITSESLIKAFGIDFEESSSLIERLLDYIELTYVLDREKLFILVNLRSIIDDDNMNMFLDTLLSHGYYVLIVDNKDYPLLSHEKRWTVDSDLCEF